MRRRAFRCRIRLAGNTAADVVGQAAATRGQTKPGGGAVMTASVALDVAGYRALLDEVFDERVVAWTAEAEATERFPRKLIEYLGASGVFTGKWASRSSRMSASCSSSPTSWAISARPASASASACTTRRSRSCADSAGPITSRPSPTPRPGAKLSCASAPPRSPAVPTFRSARPKCVRHEAVSRSAGSRSSSRCPRSPTTRERADVGLGCASTSRVRGTVAGSQRRWRAA